MATLRDTCRQLAATALLVAASSPALSAPGAQDVGIFDGRYMLQVAGSLLLVLGCLFGVLYLLKRVNGVPASDRKAIRILASLKVGAREKIVLLQTGDSQLLVGVSAGSVRTLHVFEGEAPLDPGAKVAGVKRDFGTVLEQAVPGVRS